MLPAPDCDLESVSRKLKYDLHYVDHMSFFMDARIYVATIFLFCGIRGRTIAQIMGFPYHEPDLEPAVLS